MSQQLIVTIPAAVNGVAGSLNIQGSFKIFACISTTGTYTAQGSLSSIPTKVDQAGRGFGSPTGPSYGSLRLSNTTNAAITTEVYMGDVVFNQSLIANTINVTATIGTTAVASQQKVVPVVVPGTPVQWDGAITFVQAKVIAQKDSRVPNAGNVYIGAIAAAGKQPYTLAPGDEVTIPTPAGYKLRMQDWYVDADNAGDGVVIIYS